MSYPITESQQVYLDSRNVDYQLNGSMNSNVIFFLGDKIQAPKKCIQMKISLVNFQCPVSFYVVNTNNNKLIISNSTYTAPPGNYTLNDLCTLISSWNVGTGWSATYSTVNFKVTLNQSSNFTIGAGSTMLRILGFQPGTAYTSSGGTLTAPNLPDLSGTKLIIFQLGNLTTRNIDSKTKIVSNILSVVPCNAPLLGTVMYHNESGFSVAVRSQNIDYFNVQLLDDDRNYLDFGGGSWSAAIQIDVEYLVDTSSLGQSLDDVYTALQQ